MKPTLEFANFTLKFGTKNLLDYLDQIVFPAFTSNYLRETYFNTQYFFFEVELVDLEVNFKTYKCIIGRLIKNMMLERDQIFSGGELVLDSQQLQSSPSSTFILILENHKLLLIREVKSAPAMEAFENTIRKFLKASRNQYINQIYNEAKETEEKRTKASIQKEIPALKLDVIPLLSRTELSQLVNIYEVFQSLEIKLIETNSELDSDEFFEKARKTKSQISASQASIRFSNNDGLNKAEALSQIESAGKTGNAIILTSGTGEDGTRINTKNTELNFRFTIPNLSPSIRENAIQAITALEDLVERGIITLAEPVPVSANSELAASAQITTISVNESGSEN
jgi:hypothetical protein